MPKEKPYYTVSDNDTDAVLWEGHAADAREAVELFYADGGPPEGVLSCVAKEAELPVEDL